jgi:NifU-like protein involved in Fe-S cluster formation
MSDPLYRKELLRLAADAHGAGRLPHPNAIGHAHNPTCGDKVVVDLALADGRIRAVSQETKACVLTQASASILGDKLVGASRADVEALMTSVTAMLTGGPTPSPPFDVYAVFDAALAYPSRHRCVLLPLEAVLAAFDKSEAGQEDSVGR